jgi:hypothetical protein
MRTPKSLPNSILHTAPEWYIDEFGELAMGSSEASADYRKETLPRSLRQPFSARDLNSVATCVDHAKVEKREREVREAVQERVRATFATTPQTAPVKNFQIYDEEGEKRSAVKTSTPSSTVMDEIISRAASMSVSNRKQTPEGTGPDVRLIEDTEILNIMFDTLSTALEVADARKYSYTNAAVASPTCRGGPAIWVTRYVDYTSKYGLGFLLNDGR